MNEKIGAAGSILREERVSGRTRLPALDAHRGLIMVLMAIDHASYFVARVHSREIWGTTLPAHPDALWFWTRWVTHPCATGFFFLMGIAMVLLASSRREAGWGEGRITSFFVKRGLLLIFLQLIVENTAWALGYLSATPGVEVIRGGPMPGGGSNGTIYLGVLFALGGSMVFWALARRAGTWLVAGISVAAVVITQLVTPGPDHVNVLYPPAMRLLLIPGHTNAWEVLYPVVPWLGVTGFGLVFGRLLEHDRQRTSRIAGWTALACLVLFMVIRSVGGFGNLGGVPAGWMGFFNLIKYPPSLAFLTVTLAINLFLMSFWRGTEAWTRSVRDPLTLFGRTPLFFYLAHLWVYALLGLFFRSGCGLGTMYLSWVLGLVVLYPLCYWYYGFKSCKPPESIRRFF